MHPSLAGSRAAAEAARFFFRGARRARPRRSWTRRGEGWRSELADGFARAPSERLADRARRIRAPELRGSSARQEIASVLVPVFGNRTDSGIWRASRSAAALRGAPRAGRGSAPEGRGRRARRRLGASRTERRAFAKRRRKSLIANAFQPSIDRCLVARAAREALRLELRLAHRERARSLRSGRLEALRGNRSMTARGAGRAKIASKS